MEYFEVIPDNPLLPATGNKFIFYKPITINSGLGTSVILSGDSACSFENGINAKDDITTTTYLRSKYLAVGTINDTYLSIITGRIDLGYKKVSTITETNIVSDVINIGVSSTKSTINIGTDPVNYNPLTDYIDNTINIGNQFSTINLNGNVNGFIKQETAGTRYVTATPFTAW